MPLNYILKMDESWKKHALEALSWSTDDVRKGTKAFFETEKKTDFKG
jgi:hypothetical protein